MNDRTQYTNPADGGIYISPAHVENLRQYLARADELLDEAKQAPGDAIEHLPARDAVLGELAGYLAAIIAARLPADDMFDAAGHLTPDAIAALDAEAARRLRTGDESGR